MNLPKFTKLQLFVHLAALLPLALLIWDVTRGNLSVNPIQDITFRTGKAALVLLVLTLAATPVNTIFGFRQVIKVRRALGLYAFLYASIHFFIFIGLDYGFNFRLLWFELVEKRYVLVGSTALLILIPLAITSTKGWQRRLGKTWKVLHRWVYLAGILVIIHYTWVQKSDIREPLVWGSIVVLLLALRIPVARRTIVRFRKKMMAPSSNSPIQG